MNFFKLILVDTVLDIIYFPVWWYSKGLVLAFRWTLREVVEVQNFLGVYIWIKNLFKPMFGQSDWQGKIVSFFMRIIQIFLRSIAFFGFASFYFFLFIFYLILPLIVIYFLFLHLYGLMQHV